MQQSLREQLEYPQLKNTVRIMASRYRAGVVLIEDTASGIPLIQELRREGFIRIESIKPKYAKQLRMRNQTPAIERGEVWLPTWAEWLEPYLYEFRMFPKGRYDDQVDSTSQALEFLTNGPDLIPFTRGLDILAHRPPPLRSDNWLGGYLTSRGLW